MDSEGRVFNKEWATKYLFTEVHSMAVCLIWQETGAFFKEYNISRHFATKRANCAIKLSTKEREATAQRLMTYLQTQLNLFYQQTAILESITKASFMLCLKLAKASQPLSEGKILKECMERQRVVVSGEHTQI